MTTATITIVACAVAIFGFFTTSQTFLLSDDVTLRPHVPKLPQFSQFGRSMVLVGGNQYDNNTELHETIIKLAVGKKSRL